MANQISVSVTYKNNYTYLFYLCDSYYRYLTNPNEQNAYSFIKEIVVSNDSETDYRNLELLFSIDSEVVRVDKILIDELLPKSKIQITKFIKAYLDALQLYKISEAIPCQMRVDLLADNGSAVLFSDVLSFIISPIADSVQNSKNEELFPCYVTPNSDEVSQVVSKANISLKKLRPNEPAFIGYQANDIDSVRMEMMAVYNALSESGINYSNPPAFFNQYNRVRLADQVLKEKRGTCLDLALLYCSVLESVGLNPILILVDRHAFAGCFLEKECGFENMLCTDASRVYNSSVVGNMKIELVECTGFPQSSQMSFSQSTQTARKNLAFYNGSFTAIDIHTAHKGIYRPVPTLLTDENGHQSADIAFSANNEFQTKNIEGNGVVFDGKTTEDKFSYWSKKLLDLTLKNKLINFTIGGSTIQVLVDDVSVYLKQILSGNIFISPNGIKPLKNELVIMDQQIALLKKSNPLCYLTSNDERVYKNLIRAGASAIEETGSNTLYLTVGLISYTPLHSKRTFTAPLFLVPVKGKSKVGPMGYELNPSEEEITINTTLFEFLKQNLGVSFDELCNLDFHNIQQNFMAILNDIRSKSCHECTISVDEKCCFLSTFSFAHYIMWDDINNRKDELMKNGIISSFVNSTMFVNPQDDCQDLFTLDKEIEPDSVAIPLGADSSQVKAIRDCAQGLSFVLDGPPGTGKSQTIVNMIANAMYKGKTVLFVAEKMAALNVVKKRLEKLSLGNFILEMHSNKANKKEVLRQIGDSLNCGKIKDPDQFSLLTAELTAKKKELNLLIAKLSKKKYAYSLSDCITRYESLKDFEYPKCNEDNKALTQTQEQRRVIEDDIETLKTLSSSRGEYSDNPFHYFDIKDYYPSLEEFIVRDSNDFLSSFSSLYLSYQELMKVMSIKIIPDFASLEGLYKLCILLTKEKLFFKGILSSEYGENREGNRKLVLVGKDYNDSMKKIRVYFRDDVLNCNSRADIVLLDPDQSFLKKILNHHKVVKELKPYLCSKEVRLPKKNELLALVKEIKKATFSKQYLKDNDSFLRTLLGEEYEKNTGDFSLISHYLDTIDFLLDNFDKLFDHTDSKGFTDNVNVVLNFYMNIDTFSNRSYAENFIMDYERSQKAYQILKDKYSFNENKLVITDGFFDTIIYKFSDMKASPLSFKDILTFNSLIDKLSTEGVYQPVISMFVKGDFPSTDFMEYLNVTYYSSLIKAYFADSYYHEFNGLIFTAAINKYKSIIEDYNALMIKEIAASVTSKYPLANFNYAESTNIFKLQKLVKNGGLRTSIRNILTEFEDLIRTLCPCFLMSPLSAAQYLSVSSKKFDIVIFDEASQIPTSEAIGAISRGNSLIVAGDPQQMPPTNFFKSTLSNDDDYIDIKDNFDDLESLLDDCLALGLKRNRLLWHYRSQHESLIAFSNNYFYDHELYTFPTPDYSSSRLSFNYIPDGIFSNGVNMKEADAIVEEVKRRFDDPKLCHKTIGIVTFNIKQQDLIQEKLFYFFDNNPDMMTINNENSEPLFIKNLENVQGDERDIIIFSVGFGFTKNHNFSLNFGPLSLNKGERRLNVAITRARERMLVYSSIHGSDISSERAKNKGAEVLKKFLLYAQYGTKNLIIENNQQTNIEPGIEKYIAKDLKKLGYDCDIDIGDSKFKIDLAIKDKEGKYILGIILDSTTYLSSPMCRDRNYVQISMLGRLEWKIIRVYTLDYFNDRQRTIADITSAISNISNIRSEEYVPLKTNEIEFEKVEINAFKRAKEYQVCNPSLKLEYDSLSEMVYPQLVDELTRIIDQEGPISEIMLLEKFKEILSVTKAGVKVRRILDLNLKSVPRRVVIEPFGRMFYPNDITGDNINYYRKSTLEQRDVSLVSLGEIKSMLLDILDTQGKIFYSDTVKFIATILGYKNVTAACQLKVSRLVDAAITRFPQFVKDGQWLKKLGMK